MNIIIFGPPGAGKGTQSSKISKNYNLFKVSTGDLLRDEIKNKTDLGKKINEAMNNGSLVSDSIINNLIENLMSKENYSNRLIFDGYPRTINQAKNLELSLSKFNQKISCVIKLKIDKDTIVKRILGRVLCSKCGLIFNEFFKVPDNNHKCDSRFLQKRSDDTKTTIENRYETYVRETKPIVDFYKDKNFLYEINGKNEISSIYDEISRIIGGLKGWL